MHTITRILEWDSGHRVLGHEGKCRHLHGHRYKAEITVTKSLDAISRVIDFSVIKKLVGGWIDENWDHNFLCHKDDPLFKAFKTSDHIFGNRYIVDGSELKPVSLGDLFAGKSPYVMKYGNPTAEIIAQELFEQCIRLLTSEGVATMNIRVWETPSCYADYTNRAIAAMQLPPVPKAL